jgi:hypothetical protein
MWVAYTRSDVPAWTAGDVAAMIGQTREVQTPWGLPHWTIRDGRLTRDPFRAEFLVAA